ncbi:thiamine pyrophosphate-binding protein [Okibacterium endophyticum]
MKPTDRGAPLRVAALLGHAMKKIHNGPVFGLAGSGNFELLSSFKAAGGQYVSSCHESGAVAMACGWAEITGRVGVASLHQGPGLTNAITAIVDAAKSRVPVVVLAADSPTRQDRSHQRIRQSDTLTALGAGIEVRQLNHSIPAERQLVDAFEVAFRERRTIVLNMPIDLLQHVSTASSVSGYQATRAASTPSEADMAMSVDLIGRSSSPVIIAGLGAVLSNAGQELRRLAHQIGAPLVTTAPARGLFDNDPLSVGIAGGFGSRLSAKIMKESDLVLAFGTSLDDWTTCRGALFSSEAHIIRFDVETPADEQAGARTAPPPPVRRTVQGDARAAAKRLRAATSVADHAPSARATHVAELVRGYRRSDEIPPHDGRDGVDPRRLLVDLDAILPSKRTVALDSGHFMAFAAMYVNVAVAGRYLFGQGFQSVGLGLPRAIGAASADPSTITVAIVGDGGFLMAAQELDTASRLKLPLLVVVINDSAFGAEVHDFRPLGMDTAVAQFPQRELAQVAEGFGVRGVVVRRLEDVRHLASWAAESAGPLVLDCRVDPGVSAVTVMTEEGKLEWRSPHDE